MSPHNISEQEFAELVRRKDRDPIERVQGGVVGTRGGLSPAQGSRTRNGCAANGPMLHDQHGQAGSNPAPSPIYKSKWDEAYGYVMVLEKRTGLIRDYGYETMSLKLSKGKYHRPDYTVWHLDGSIELRQIKGYHKNIRASLTALKWAAQTHPWFLFTLWRRVGQGWEREQVSV